MIQRSKRWNLFARELEDILRAHNLHLGLLDDHMGIHREKIQRLQQSLLTPKSFPVLNPEELELLVQIFDLSAEEGIRLRAAFMATAVERTLMDRIDQNNALLASEQIQTILRDTLLLQFEQKSGMGSIRDEDGDAIEHTEGREHLEDLEEVPQTVEQFRKKLGLLKLLKNWREGDEQEQQSTWEYLKESLDNDRLSERKLFP